MIIEDQGFVDWEKDDIYYLGDYYAIMIRENEKGGWEGYIEGIEEKQEGTTHWELLVNLMEAISSRIEFSGKGQRSTIG